MAEAWEYVQHQLAVCDHPIPYINAAMVRQRQAYAAASWFEQALAHQPSRRSKPALLEMLAIARAQLGHDAETIESLFREALSLDPANPRTAHNLQVFLNGRVQVESSAQQPWDRHGLEPTVPAGAPMELPQRMPCPLHAQIMVRRPRQIPQHDVALPIAPAGWVVSTI